jgi:tetratricopeptide (TPR) repeat protein
MMTVKAWHEKVIIPTYEIGTPEKSPIFLEKRVYQGSSGSVYPHPVVEKISDEKIDKEWDAIFIENDFIKVMVLPALGGRIQMAYDKIRERHFVYYNQVIKPALVGLTGPWISGGIEFNWPQHHRPSTYDATDFKIEENQDGSITVWVSELERMFRTKGMAGFTLYPDKAYIEIKGQLYNRTPHAQTFLWWANPAVSVNDDYQSVFPPDVNAVFDHGKRDVSEFPIAKGEYYKVDYSPGTDISKYKNIPVPTSYMAITSDYDFVGGYENDTKGGLLHVADHHVSPGKKQWTWGNGDFGFAWDRNLTDEDGPYIELMCGVYTDNQPDFSWMQPYEEKSFKQYFMPYYNVGVVKNATKEGMLNLELEQGKATLKIHVTGIYPNSTLVLKSDNQIFIQETLDLDPANGYENTVEVGEIPYHELSISLKDSKGNVIISWQPEATKSDIIPEAAKAAKDPKNIDSIEQLYLTGLHLEQYRHATYNATDYYLEALSREPGDVRNNNAMGLWLMKKGQFEKALPYFEKAIETLTQRNPNPQDGEPFFNKGLTLNYLGKKDEAYKSFFKAAWNAAWQDASYFNLAQIDAAKGDLNKALELVDKSLIRNWHNHKARHLKVILLRKMGKIDEAKALIEASLVIDNFNFGVLFEKYIISKEEQDLQFFKDLIRDNPHNYLEFAIDYAQAGQFEDAIILLSIYAENKSEVYPMIAYFMGYYYCQMGNTVQAKRHYDLAQKMPKDYCFPNRLEEVIVLKSVLETEKNDANAPYYLGNFWYAGRQYAEAQTCWETSIKLNDNNAICHRNLALLYYNKTNQEVLARTHLEHAFSLDKTDARLLMELDQLYKKFNLSVDFRLQVLEENLDLTLSRDDLYLERASLYNFKGEHQIALELINQRQFHPWEGGEGKVPYQYINANVELAKQYIKDGLLEKAIQHLEDAQVYPHHLGEGKLAGAQENDINYWLGCIYQKLGNQTLANELWNKAAEGLSDPSPAFFYNDQQPDKIFYQGMALLKLGNHEAAQKRFENLLNYGKKHKNDEVKLDYFAVSLPDLLIWEEDLSLRNKIHCDYLIGLGELGLGNQKEASEAFDSVFSKDLFHLSAFIHQKMIEEMAFVEV